MIILQSTADRQAKRRRRIAAAFTRTHHPLERQTVRSLQAFYRSVGAGIARNLRARGSTVDLHVDDLFRRADWREPFWTSMVPRWNAALWTGVAFEEAWVSANRPEQQSLLIRQDAFGGVDAENPEPPPSIRVDPSPELQRKIRRFLKERMEGTWGQVSKTMRTRLQRSILRGLTEGDTLDQLERRLRRTMRGLSRAQARRIARSETTGSMNFGGQAEREELGITRKEWSSVFDGRNRGADPKSPWDHLTPDGQKVDNVAPFIVSGEQLQYPGDRAGSPGNTINCRCVAVGAWD